MRRPIVALCATLGLATAASLMGIETANNGLSVLTDAQALEATGMISFSAGLLPAVFYEFLGRPSLTRPRPKDAEIIVEERSPPHKPIVLMPRYA